MRFSSLLLLLIATITVHADEAPIPVTDQKQLFIDHKFIADSQGIELRLNPAQKLGLIHDENGARIHGHTSMLLDVDNKFRLYIGADSVDIYESTDGMVFTRTGDSVRGGIFTTVFHDTHDPDPARRWKMFWIQAASPFNPETDGVYAGYSADGINITRAGRVLPYYVDNPTIVTWDPRINKYVIYTRAIELNVQNQRRIARIETEDILAPWPHTKTDDDHMFFQPKNTNVVLMADEQDDPLSDIYYNAFTPYPFAQDVSLMFTAQFRHFLPERQPFIRPPNQHWEDFGLLEIQLALSRDGIKWQRPSREPYFPTGLADEWDRWYAVMAPGIVRRGNYLYQFYNSSGRSHDGAILRPEYDIPLEQLGGIGATRQRLDGFISADATHTGGHITTPVMTFTGKRLRLNIDTGAMGTAFVELRDPLGVPIPGYTLDDCEEIGGNFIDQTVYWRANPDLNPLIGQPIQLHIKLTRAKLYAFQFTHE